MSYEKQTWQTGDTITAEKLNHMEDGIASGGCLIVNKEYGEDLPYLDKTYDEIKSALFDGKVVLIKYDNSYEDDVAYEFHPIENISERVYLVDPQANMFEVFVGDERYASSDKDGVLEYVTD